MHDTSFFSLFASVLLALTLATHSITPADAAPSSDKIEQVIDISPVWAGHPVGFSLLTYKDWQFVAFYDDQRRMTVATRKLRENTWRFARLPESVGWDSHNYITMTVDDDDHLHLSGNMHVVPLIYFRTTRPLDIDSFERIPSMVGTNEQRTTYPVFLRGPKNELLFTYRDGSSGNGDQIYNLYDHKTRTWKRLLDKPLTNGEGERNAYFEMPRRGPDGYFHMVWVWRETPDAATNHDPTYARSKDLVHWEKSDGTPLPLPITLKAGEIVDPVPVGGGIINGNVKVGFDTKKRPIVSYHKHDANGKTQIYNARREESGWKIYPASNWDYRWEFGGGGSIPFELGVGPVQAGPDGRLTQTFRHAKFGSGVWVLDEATLKPTATLPPQGGNPPELGRVESKFAGMQARTAGDSGKSGEPGVRYVLRWETLGQNRDRPREGPVPPPSMLKLYKLRTTGSN